MKTLEKTRPAAPKWCENDLYDLDAKLGGNPLGSGQETGSMLSALLAERFKLTIHRESTESPRAMGRAGPEKVKGPELGISGPALRGWR